MSCIEDAGSRLVLVIVDVGRKVEFWQGSDNSVV